MNSKTKKVSPVIVSLLVAFPIACLQKLASAHEIPADVVVQTMLKPEGRKLDFLVRVPLEAMRDVSFPVRGAGYLDVAEAEEYLHDAAEIWIAREVSLFEGDRLLTDREIVAARIDLPSDRSFVDFDRAYGNVTSPPLPADTEIFRDQALLDVLIRYDIESDTSDFSIDPAFARLGLNTTTVVRFLHTDGVERLFEFSGDPGLVRLDPRWHHAFLRFVQLGIVHILDGIDHLLFVICLLIPFRRIRPLIAIITAFTVAHSTTLIASAFGLVPAGLWFPPLIETLIAASIVYMALENIVGSKWQRRWVIAFAFGLVHGFGFSFALSETLQFAGTHLITSLLAFNLGVEIGQVLVILLAVPLLNLAFRNANTERVGTIILSAILAHSAWHWMSGRFADLRAYGFDWPVPDYALGAALLRWLMFVLIVGSIVWLLFTLYRRFIDRDTNVELPKSTGADVR